MTMMPVLDETNGRHVYRMADGRVVPGVTSILRDAGIIDDQWFTDEARARGQAVHACIHYYQQGALDEKSIDPAIEPYWKAYLEFRKHADFTPVLFEHVVYSKTQDYACKIDVFGRWQTDGCRSIIEFKSGHRPPWVDIQLAAQQQACFESGLRPTRLYSLELRKDARFDLKEHKNAHEALGWFLAARQKVREDADHPSQV